MSAAVLIIFTVIGLSVPFLLKFLIKKCRFRKLINKIPGPDGRLLFGSAIEFLKCPETQRIEFLEERFEKYGSIFRLWIGFQPVINIGNAEDAQVILTSNVNIDKSIIYKLAEPWIGTGLLTSTGKKWLQRRKLLTPAFHFSTLNSFFGIMVENCNILLEKLKAEENSDEFNISTYINNCSLDIICETAMGVKVNAQEGSSEYLSALREFGDVLITRFLSPWLWLDWMFAFSTYSKKHKHALGILHGFTLKVIEEKKKERQSQNTNTSTAVIENEDLVKSSRKKPFLDLLLDISEEYEGTFSNDDLREEVDTFMFAGHDTVSTSSSWATFLIGLHPDIQENIFEELFSVFGNSDRDPTIDDIRQLKYLDMVLKECMRICPTVTNPSRNLSEDVVLSGYKVPAGSTVEMNIHHIHRNAKYYEKPNDFYPEHFSTENNSSRHPYAFIPFSAGPRNCIGQKFALFEEKLLISSLFRRYKIKSVQKFEDVPKVSELVVRPGDGIKVKISRRNYSEL